ncbi:MAG: ComEC/Rec2 family competence protein [Saprospiraceae bacterium]
MYQRQIPFLRLIIPWLAGIAAGATFDWPIPGIEYCLAAGAALLLLLAKWRFAYQFRWTFGACAFALVFATGYWLAYRCDERRQTAHFARVCPDAEVFSGIVSDAPAKGTRLKVRLRVEAAGVSADSMQACTGNILLLFSPTAEAERLRYGDRIWARATVRPTDAAKNPHAFDYGRYLHFQNVHHQAFVKDSTFGLVSSGHGHPIWRMAFHWRERLLAVLHEHFPDRDEYAVASALLVGYKEDLSEELRASYAETGSMHALAVSGTHVGLMYAAFLFLLRRMPWRGNTRRWGETSVVLIGIWAFTLLTGATASVMRASVMFTCFLMGKAIRRTASIWNILGVSAFLLLWLNPYFLFDAGFQLSYAAVAGIVVFYPMLQKALPRLPKWADLPWSILLIGVAAQLGTMPLSLYYFHQFPVYFWLAGWVVVVGGAVFLWSGSVLVLLDAVAPVPADWLGWLLCQMLRAMNWAVQAIQHLPGSVFSGIWITGWAAVALYIFIGLLTGAVRMRNPRLLLSAFGVLALLGIGRAVREVLICDQREVVLYHQNRRLIVDFFDGQRLLIWTDSLDTRRERFAAQTNRWAHGARLSSRPPPNFERPYREPNLLVQPPFAQFFDLKMVVLGHRSQLPKTGHQATPVDVLVLRNNVKIRLSDCLRCFPCRLVVLDATNSLRQAERWQAECRDLGLPFYDVREMGAWCMDVAPADMARFRGADVGGN